MVCVLRSRLECGALTPFCINFLRYRTGGHFRSEKNDPEMGQAPTSQARPRDTDHLRPSNLEAGTLTLVERTLSNFGGDPCPVRRGLVAVVKCCKSTFFLAHAVNRKDRSLPTALLAGFSTMKGNPVLFSVFQSHNSRPY